MQISHEPQWPRDIIAGLASVEKSHFLDDRRREFALFRELAATAISSPARGVAMRPPSALSVRSLRFRRAPVGLSGDLLSPSPPAEKATDDVADRQQSWRSAR